jgi:hypothetical protein
MRKEKWIIEAYKMADEQEKLDMYMTCRDHRGEFDEIETRSKMRERSLEPQVEPQIEAKPFIVRWNFCGRLMKALGN